MKTKFKIMSTNEIDLSLITKILLKNLGKIVIITIITTIMVMALFLYDRKNNIHKSLFLSETKIQPISIFDDFNYSAYNGIINFLIKKIDSPDINNKKSNSNLYQNDITKIQNHSIFEGYNFEVIDRVYLYDLFIQKIKENEFIEDNIKKFNFVKRENYQNNRDYELAIDKLAALIIVDFESENKENVYSIRSKTDSKENWNEFLNYLEKSTNKEVQIFLTKKFEYLITDLKRIISYIVEDINFEISNNQHDEEKIAELINAKNRMVGNRYIERLNTLFSKTPISNSDKFSAANFQIKDTKYIDISNKSYTIKKVILFSIIMGTILGIIFVLISNRPKN
jgi:hypothetical protein